MDPTAVLILAGGEGRRLGVPKAWLAWRGRPLLLEVIERTSGLAPRAPLVAARPGQELPPGPYDRVDDAFQSAGPLAGLAAGLATVAETDPDARVAVIACDYPFADPTLLRGLAALDTRADLVLPRWEGHLHPLQALWRAWLAEPCTAVLARGERRLGTVIETTDAVIVAADRIDGVIPARALLNLNAPDDLARARALAGGP